MDPQISITWSASRPGRVMILLAIGLVPLVLIAGWDEDDAADRGAYRLVLAHLLQAFMVVIFRGLRSDGLLLRLRGDARAAVPHDPDATASVTSRASQKAAMKFPAARCSADW